MKKDEASPLGIIMGRGDLPQALADFCKSIKRAYYLFPIESQADESFVQHHPHVWISPGSVKKNLLLFKQRKIKELVFIGHIKRPSLLSLKLDFLALKWLISIGWKAKGDDGLLSGIVSFLEQEGFKVMGIHQLIHKILMPKGALGSVKPSTNDIKNIKQGAQAAQELGKQDIGQAVVVEEGHIVARETQEGTDWMLEHASRHFKSQGKAILVKMAKPQQEKRVDLPTIGPKTIEKLALYGYKGVALEAGAGLIVNQEQVIKMANEKGIFVYGV
ncbi:MAG: LpxI family protein [Alphaproteobacteria bacterium]